MTDAIRMQRAIDRSEIMNLIARSILTRDSGDWTGLAECYHSDAEFTSSWWTGKASEFIAAADAKLKVARKAGGEQKHVSSNFVIEVAGERATAECDITLYMRRTIKGIEMDFATSSRRIFLFATENGAWKIWRRFAIYEKDRVDAVDPKVDLADHIDQEALARYPKQIRFHLWRNSVHGSEPVHNLCLRGTAEEAVVRQQARNWIEQ